MFSSSPTVVKLLSNIKSESSLSKSSLMLSSSHPNESDTNIISSVASFNASVSDIFSTFDSSLSIFSQNLSRKYLGLKDIPFTSFINSFRYFILILPSISLWLGHNKLIN